MRTRDRTEKIHELDRPGAGREAVLSRQHGRHRSRCTAPRLTRGRRFVVVILPILVDVRAGTFAPVYAEIRRALDAARHPLHRPQRRPRGERDSSLWILPFDQHPNERAHAAFARRLTDALLAEP